MAVVEEGHLHANGFDMDGNIYPVEVPAGARKVVAFDITYRAAF